jgi:restriction endonuclease S subunit
MSITGWQSERIGELLASSLPGDWGTESNPEYGVPVLRSANFRDDGSIDYSDIAFRSIAKARLERRRIGIGTVLIEKAGGSSTRPAGRVVYCDREFNGTASNFVEIVHVKEDYSPKFVFYRLYLNFQSGLVNKYQQQTTGIINFKLREYFDEVIELPNTKLEQSKIAQILSTVDRAIERTKVLIAKQQRIKTGLMQDLLTRGIDAHGNLRSERTHEFKDSPLGRIPAEWEAQPLSSVVDLTVGYAFKSSWFTDDGLPLLRGENVGHGRPDWKDCKCLPHLISARFSDYLLYLGDIIIGMDRTFTKRGFKVSLLGENDVPSLLVQRVGRFVPVDIPRGFMKVLVQSPRYQRELLLRQKGMDIPHLSKREILNPLVPVPSSADEMAVIATNFT